MTLGELEKLFPKTPDFRGIWSPVYLETIYGSGEQLTVAVSAVGLNGEHTIISCLSESIIECMFGEKSEHFYSMIDWIIQSLDTHLSNHQPLQEWRPPFKGVTLGTPVRGADDNIQGLLNQAIRFSSFFGSLQLEEEEDFENDKEQSLSWANSVKQEIEEVAPFLSESFGRKIKIGGTYKKYGFMNEKYACNFSPFNARNSSYGVRVAKSNIIDLQDINESGLLLIPESKELILIRPMLDNNILSQSQIQRAQDRLAEIERVAKIRNITIYKAKSPEDNARHILEMAG